MIYRLKWFEYAALLLLVGIGYALIIKQEFAIPEFYRTGSLLLILLGIYLAFFFIVRPRHPMALSNFLSCFCSAVTATLIVVQHVVLNAGFSYTVNVVILGTFFMPFPAGYLYSRFVKKRRRKL